MALNGFSVRHPIASGGIEPALPLRIVYEKECAAETRAEPITTFLSKS